MKSARRWAILVGVSIFLIGLVRAAVVPQRSSRFDRVVVQDPSSRLGMIAEKPEALPGYDQELAGWNAFRGKHGPGWSIHIDRRSGSPLLVEGQGVRWFQADASVTKADFESRAKQFVRENVALFKIDDSELVLSEEGSGPIDKDHSVVLFNRAVAGVPVEEERLVLFITRGNLTAFGVDHWGAVREPSQPVYSADTAREVLYSFMGILPRDQVQEVEPERLVYVGAPAEDGDQEAYAGAVGEGMRFHLTWRFAIRVAGERGTWVGKVDARTGNVIALYDDNKYGQVKGGVYPVSDDGVGWDGTEQAGWPMPFCNVTIDGTPYMANDMGIFDCSPMGGTAVTQLAGPYVRVGDTCGSVNESVTCDADLDLAQGPGTDCTVPAGHSSGDDHAARAGFYHLNRVMEKGRAWLPNNSWLRSQLLDNVNIFSTCNAYWDGYSVNFYRSGGGCRNTGEIAGVFVHEWGHGIDENDGGGYDNPSEAYSDIVAFMQTHVSCVGRGFFMSGNCSGYGDTCINCTGIRDQDWNKRQNHTPATPQGFLKNYCGGGSGPCGKETHCESYVAGEAIWDLAVRDMTALGLDTRTAWQLTDKLWYKSRNGSGGNAYNCNMGANTSDGCGAGSWFTKLRVVDDDDGNLNNGTPHASAIYSAFARHNIACGLASDASNQNTSSCPTLQIPTLTARAGSGAATLTWDAVPGATNYLILRNEQGCDTAFTLIDTVTAPGTSYTDMDLPNGFQVYYAVQAQGSNTACESALSNCMAVTPQPFAGTIKFDRATYGCEHVAINVTVLDANIGAPTTTVSVFSASEPTPETIVLTEIPPGSAKYYGSILTTSGPAVHGDGLLTVSDGAAITAQYLDADDGMGGTNLLREATSLADCRGPVISMVQSSGVSDVQAAIAWQTDEPSSSIVHYGGTRPPENLKSSSTLVMTHNVVLNNLQQCTVYYYSVESQDSSGNVAIDDGGGLFHHFETLGNFGSGLQPCHQGRVSLSRTTVGCSDVLTVKLVDMDLNVSPTVAESVVVDVTSTTETTPERLTLVETGPNTSTFTGSIPTSPAASVAGDGILSAKNGDYLTATYHDANDGTGSAAISFATAVADCAAPDLSGVQVASLTDDSVVVMWTTSEPTTGRVDWGATVALGSTVSDSSLSTTHSLVLQPLAECGHFYFRVFSTDAYGNATTMDVAGAPFEFNAYQIPGWVFKENFETSSGWRLEGEWEIGAPQGRGSAPGDPTAAFTGAAVLGDDLSGLGEHPGDYEPQTNERAISPNIDASGITSAQLKFRRWLNVGGGGIAYVEAKVGNDWVSLWNSGSGGITESSWSLQTIDISQYADGNRSFQFAFRQKGGLNQNGNRAGWNVDRVIVKPGNLPDFDACGSCGGAPSFGGATSARDANPCGDTGITVTWKVAPAWGTGHAGSYSVYRDTDPSFTPSAANRVATGVTGTTWTDSSAPNDVVLYYVVRAENDETCSTGPKNGGMTDANLVRVSSRDETIQIVPGDVGSTLLATVINEAHVRLTWASTPSAVDYHVYRSASPQGPFTKIAEVSGTTFDDKDQLGNSANAYYRVKAANSCSVEGP